MSSVLVKGMDMPKNCAYCPLSEYRNTSLGQILDCKRIGTVGSAVRDTHDVLNHRHPNCPLVDSPEPHWIPVTERLPQTGESVMICDAYGDICIGHRTMGGYYFPDFCDDKIKDVRAWCNLPEPYKGVTT